MWKREGEWKNGPGSGKKGEAILHTGLKMLNTTAFNYYTTLQIREANMSANGGTRNAAV